MAALGRTSKSVAVHGKIFLPHLFESDEYVNFAKTVMIRRPGDSIELTANFGDGRIRWRILGVIHASINSKKGKIRHDELYSYIAGSARGISDLLTEVLQSGARRLLAHAVEAEVSSFIDTHADHRLTDGRARIVRHGHFSEQNIQTGIGAVRVQQPRVRDRANDGSEKIRFSPFILPKHARRTRSLDAVLPVL